MNHTSDSTDKMSEKGSKWTLTNSGNNTLWLLLFGFFTSNHNIKLRVIQKLQTAQISHTIIAYPISRVNTFHHISRTRTHWHGSQHLIIIYQTDLWAQNLVIAWNYWITHEETPPRQMLKDNPSIHSSTHLHRPIQ